MQMMIKLVFVQILICLESQHTATTAFQSPFTSIHLHQTSQPSEIKLFQRSSPFPRPSSTLKAVTASVLAENDVQNIEGEEMLLLQSIQTYKDSNKDKPSLETFVNLIEKWLQFPQPLRAESLLDRMEEFYTPSGRIYERIINAWSFGSTELLDRLAQIDDTEDDDSDDIEIRDMKLKNRKVMRENAVYCADRSVDLLNRMEQLCEEIGDDFRPALSTYTSVVNAVLRSSDKNVESFAARREVVERIRAKRDFIYKNIDAKKLKITTVRDVFSTLKYIENPNISQKLAKVSGERLYVPNRYNFNIIINALAQTGEAWAAHACEDILDFMIRRHVDESALTPTIETVNGCINAWARCTTDSRSASRAEGILEKLNLAQTSSGLLTNVVPDNVSYNTIIRANGANAERAEAILDTMMDLYKSTGDPKIKPDLISYSSVLNAYAKAASNDPNASSKSEEILNKMVKMQESEDGEMLVNTWCFNTVSDVSMILNSTISVS